MRTSKDIFKNNIDKAFSNISLNSSTLKDHMKYKQGFTEETLEGGLADGKTLKDIAKKHNKKGYYHIDNMISSLKKQLAKGIKVEMEHTKDKAKAREIAMDHLWEHPNYYDRLEKIEVDEEEGRSKYYPGGKTPGLTSDVLSTILRNMSKIGSENKEEDKEPPKNRFRTSKKKETKEATGSGSSGAYVGPVFGGDDEFWKRSKSETPGLKESDVEKVEAKEATTSGSVGGYETPSMWAKSTKKKDWGPSRKTQIPGGGFVKIKKRCTKFPYCNQGDISNLKISKNESVKGAIKNVANKLNISENVIITILEHEYQNRKKTNN